MRIGFQVNGRPVSLDVPPMRRLLDLLRFDLGLTGAKEGCGEGECGACAVLIDGELVNSCLVPAVQIQGRSIRTIEDLGTEERPDPLQSAFLDEGAMQCGFCIPGMVLAARALLDREPRPDRTRIREALSGNLCRCTGYEKVVRAVERVAGGIAGLEPLTAEAGTGRIEAREAEAAGHGEPGMAEAVSPEAGSDAEPAGMGSPGDAVLVTPAGLSEAPVATPASLSEALGLLEETGPGAVILAGGTDLMAAPVSRPPSVVIDLSRLPELASIEVEGNLLRIGAGVTVSRLAASPEVRGAAPVLHQAAVAFGAPAIRNRATVGGNLVSASPAADLPPALLVLDARVVLAGPRGKRDVALADFYTGYRRTVRRPDEILTQILVPSAAEGQAFYKVGPRQAQSIAKVSLACRAERDAGGRVRACRLAAGSVGPTVVTLTRTERLMLGQRVTPERAREAGRAASLEVRPIDDLRSTAHYRRVVLGRLVTRFFLGMIG